MVLSYENLHNELINEVDCLCSVVENETADNFAEYSRFAKERIASLLDQIESLIPQRRDIGDKLPKRLI